MRFMKPIFLTSFLLAAASGVASQEAKPKFHGAAWMQFGRIENSFAFPPNGANNYDENWLGNYGGLVASSIQVNENWDGSLGLGSILVHLPRGNVSVASIWYPFWVGFVTEARLTYTQSQYSDNGGLQLTFGAAPYSYSRDAKNLGLYLLKGYVYPGTIVSGYADLFGVPSTRTGVLGRYRKGGFTNDLMLNVETEDKPLYDFSVADVITWNLHPSLEIGAGVNFYRLIPQVSDATSPGKDCNQSLLGPYVGGGPGKGQDNPCFIIEPGVNGAPPDTITGSLAGTKLMGRLRLDPKAWFGSPGIFGPDEMVLYTEAAILGLKDYPLFYDDILRRIPVMVGFNLPTFKAFNLSVEAEYYASKNSSDNLPAQSGSWLPSGTTNPNPARDDWKWSVNASKVVLGHIFLGAQVANDHLRLGGTHDTATGQEAMRTLQDWYWAFKTAYFF